MQDLKITLVQTTQDWENKAQNLNRFEQLVSQMKEETDLILLPEMCSTGFSMNAKYLAEGWENSETLERLKLLSRNKNAAIYTSLIINDQDKYFNRGVFIQPSGEVSHYDKRKTFGLAGEDKTYSAGNHELIVEFRGWKINLQICYDLRFPELVRNKMIDDRAAYDLILYVANWPEKRAGHWKTLLKARAIENQCYVAGLNRIGTDGKGLKYQGDSKLVDILGEEYTCSPNKEEVRTLTCNKEYLLEWREKLPFLKDA